MKLSSIGERGLIELFSKIYEKSRCKDVLVSIGDDCAVISLGKGECLLVSTDTVLEGTHIPREMTPEQMGIYAVNVVLSDIAAMGGEPMGLVFSMAFPPHLEDDFIREVSVGMESAANEHETCIIGGDTKEASGIALTGTAIGRIKEENLLLRSRAKTRDLIGLTGEVGSAAAAFHCLVKGAACPSRFIKKAFEPKARLKEGRVLSKYANACIDVSDGLAWSIHEITSRSGVGATIYEEQLPTDKGLLEVVKLTGVSKREIALYKGGDYELLYTFPREKKEVLLNELKELGSKPSVIGEITKKDNYLVDENGKKIELERRGWEAFKNPPVF